MCTKMKGDPTMDGNTRSLIVSATALAAGFCAGLGTGVLFAPYSGSRTRRQLRNFAEDKVKDTGEAVDEIIDRGKRFGSRTLGVIRD